MNCVATSRAYGEAGDAGAASARAALAVALSALQRLLAPVLPFVAEEAWSWWHDGSVHRSAWPADVPPAGDPRLRAVSSQVLAAVRGAKSTAKVSMRTEVPRVVVRGPSSLVSAVAADVECIEDEFVGSVSIK